MVATGELQEHLDRLLRRRQRHVIVKRADVLEDFRITLGHEPGLTEACGPLREVRQRSSRVGEDDLDVLVRADVVRHDQVDGRPRRLVGVVDDRLWDVLRDEVRVHRVGGVDKHHRGPFIQSPPHGLEGRVAQVHVARPIARHESHAVGFQRVHGEFDLRECGGQVDQAGHSGEEAVPAGVLVADGGQVFVCGAGEFGGTLFAGDGGARRGQGEDGGADIQGPTELVVGFETPRGCP